MNFSRLSSESNTSFNRNYVSQSDLSRLVGEGREGDKLYLPPFLFFERTRLKFLLRSLDLLTTYSSRHTKQLSPQPYSSDTLSISLPSFITWFPIFFTFVHLSIHPFCSFLFYLITFVFTLSKCYPKLAKCLMRGDWKRREMFTYKNQLMTRNPGWSGQREVVIVHG